MYTRSSSAIAVSSKRYIPTAQPFTARLGTKCLHNDAYRRSFVDTPSVGWGELPVRKSVTNGPAICRPGPGAWQVPRAGDLEHHPQSLGALSLS